jgi:hypothetical protein
MLGVEGEGGEAQGGSAELLALPLSGRALRPRIHLELPASDYLASRDAARHGLRGPGGEPPGAATLLPADLRVLHLRCLGTGVRNSVRFYAVNPTAEAYDF